MPIFGRNCIKTVPLRIQVGSLTVVKWPGPHWPSEFVPHAHTFPFASRANENSAPSEIWTIFSGMAVRSLGVSVFPVPPPPWYRSWPQTNICPEKVKNADHWCPQCTDLTPRFDRAPILAGEWVAFDRVVILWPGLLLSYRL